MDRMELTFNKIYKHTGHLDGELTKTQLVAKQLKGFSLPRSKQGIQPSVP